MKEETSVPKPPAEPGAAHRRLEVFVGTWHCEGESFAEGQATDDPRASALPWISDETYEWLPGNFFLLHRWQAKAGSRRIEGAEVIGCDESAGGYFTRFFDNTGNHPEYRVEVEGPIWTFSEPSTRARVTVAAGGQSMRFDWEWKNDGKDWLPLCERTAVKVGSRWHAGRSPQAGRSAITPATIAPAPTAAGEIGPRLTY